MPRYKFRKQVDDKVFSAPGRGDSKYDVHEFPSGKYIASFGHRDYGQYEDKLGYYGSKDHKDSKRRQNYYKRHGKLAKPLSAKYFAHKYLW